MSALGVKRTRGQRGSCLLLTQSGHGFNVLNKGISVSLPTVDNQIFTASSAKS
jgi:hypothetical protein